MKEGYIMDKECLIEINPTRSFIDEAVDITISGLQSNQKVVIRAVTSDYYCINAGMSEQGQNSLWESYGIFTADHNGNISLKKDSPVDGTYQACDGMGLFYSMRLKHLNKSKPLKTLSDVSENRSYHICFTVESQGKVLASKECIRQFCDDTIESRALDQKSYVARYYTSRIVKKRPTVIVVSGSEGRIEKAQAIAEILAQRGYSALAVCYFGMKGISSDLNQIPLEIIENSIQWLKQQNSVDEKHIGIYGRSKGGEYALAAASIFDELTCVIANTPSCYVYEGLKGMIPSRHSSWTYGGQDLPFLKFSYPVMVKMAIKKVLGQKELVRWMYQQVITSARTDKANLEVEKINGPILFLSSAEDSIWPSFLHCETAVKRLHEKNFRYDYKHCTYEKSGHMLTLPYQSISSLKKCNGNVKEWQNACLNSWKETTDFLDMWSKS